MRQDMKQRMADRAAMPIKILIMDNLILSSLETTQRGKVELQECLIVYLEDAASQVDWFRNEIAEGVSAKCATFRIE